MINVLHIWSIKSLFLISYHISLTILTFWTIIVIISPPTRQEYLPLKVYIMRTLLHVLICQHGPIAILSSWMISAFVTNFSEQSLCTMLSKSYSCVMYNGDFHGLIKEELQVNGLNNLITIYNIYQSIVIPRVFFGYEL